MIKKLNTIALLLLVFSSIITAQDLSQRPDLDSTVINEIEFRNQRVQDVLLTLARLGKISIIFDSTVDGTTSHYFRDVTVREALTIVANSNNLFLSEKDGIYYVSKILIDTGANDGEYSVHADKIRLGSLFDALSRESGITILYDNLPSQDITINADSLPLERILTIAMSRFPDYELISEPDFYQIKALPRDNTRTSSIRSGRSAIVRTGDLYSVDGENLRFTDLISDLFAQADKEYVLLKESDSMIDTLRFSNKSFDEMLSIILQLGGADVQKQGDLYYILDLGRAEIINQHALTVQIPLQHIQAESLPSLFPSGLISNNSYKIDRENNRIILSGTSGEIDGAIEFIKMMDVPLEDKQYHRFEFVNTDSQEVIGLLPNRLKPSQPLVVPGQNAFIMLTTSSKADEINQFINLLDTQGAGVPIRLRYIKGQQLLDNLPPSVTRDNIVQTADPTLVFFKGSNVVFENFTRELEQIDQPIPQIRYQVLVIQFQDRKQYNYSLNIGNSRLTTSEASIGSSFLGAIGKLLSLNFDIISIFGYLFAVDLNWSLSRSEAQILVDSSITGLSGEEVSFRNTNTSRIRTTETVESDTTTTRTVTLEISSGLNINITGWTSGNGMITMDVSTSISRQFNDSGEASTLPSTNERTIDTHVRTLSGEPVTIGGLVSQEASNNSDGTPLISDIPGVGKAFSDQNQTAENTELTVYIIPYLEYSFTENSSLSDLFDQLYREHMEQ